MFVPLFAANWDDLIKVAMFVIAALYWLITAFGKKAPGPKPERPQPIEIPDVDEAAAGGDPLQSEIEDFLREAKAKREGRPVEAPAPPVRQPAEETTRRKGTRRRSPSQPPRRNGDSQTPRLPPLPTPVVVEVVPDETRHESLADRLAQREERDAFGQRGQTGLGGGQRTASMTQLRQASDSEFQQHMQGVFDRPTELPTAVGVFEAAGDAAAVQLAAAGGGGRNAPPPIRARNTDIALFLAGKKNVRDAVVLSEILKRPEERW